jgi:hypothetical protein
MDKLRWSLQCYSPNWTGILTSYILYGYYTPCTHKKQNKKSRMSQSKNCNVDLSFDCHLGQGKISIH